MCTLPEMSGKQDCKIFVGGMSWETNNDKLRAYFENFGTVKEAFISVNRTNGRPRGFGFVTFESPEIAKKVIATKHTIDRREVEAKESFAKEEQSSTSQASSEGAGSKNRKLFVGGLAPAVDDAALREHFETFGPVDSAEVMLDHDTKRPRGFGFVTFVSDDSVDKVFQQGAMQTILDKKVEIKVAMPRDQMPSQAMPMHVGRGPMDSGYGRPPNGFYPPPYGQFQAPAAGYGPRGHPNNFRVPYGVQSGRGGGGPGNRPSPIGPNASFPQAGRGYNNGGGGAPPGVGQYPLQNLDMFNLFSQLAAQGQQQQQQQQQMPDYNTPQGQQQVPGIKGGQSIAVEIALQQLAQLNVSGPPAPATASVSYGPVPSGGATTSSGLDTMYTPSSVEASSMGPGWSS